MLIKTYAGSTIEAESLPTAAADLLALPALIDCHVHFRTPGAEHKETWMSGAKAALAGGVTTVLDMPNNTPSITTRDLLEQKTSLVDQQLAAARVPLRRYFYFGATPTNYDEAYHAKEFYVGIKLFMGSSTGDLLVDKTGHQKEWFQIAAELGKPLAIHAEDEAAIKKNKDAFPSPQLADHSRIRSPLVAARALEKALAMANDAKTRLYVLHISSKEEITLIQQAKQSGVEVYAETTPHHLFLTVNEYETLGTKAQMNPPLRGKPDQEALWEALNDGTIDVIATDHAPHTLEEKSRPYPESPSGVPGIETMLPLLLDASRRGLVTIPKIVALTRSNPEKIFALPKNEDWVIVDPTQKKTVQNERLKTKCGWSPFAGWELTGWPIATLLRGKIHTL